MSATHVLTGMAATPLPDLTYEKKTWCGREERGFAFQDPTHAALYARNSPGGHLRICRACAEAIIAALDEGSR